METLTEITKNLPQILQYIQKPPQLISFAVLLLSIVGIMMFRGKSGTIQITAFLALLGSVIFLCWSVISANANVGDERKWLVDGQIACVVVNDLDEVSGDGFLSVRSLPSASSTQLAKVYNNDVLHLHERGGSWLRIRFVRSAQKIEGWVWRGFTSPIECG